MKADYLQSFMGRFISTVKGIGSDVNDFDHK